MTDMREYMNFLDDVDTISIIEESTGSKITEILTEDIHPEQYGLKQYRGGQIVFSTDVNATEQGKGLIGKIKSWFKSKLSTFLNRLKKDKKLARVIQQWNKEFGGEDDQYIGAYTIGPKYKGQYTSDDGKVFDENSTSIEIGGAPSELLLLLGAEIAKEFGQETVLVKDENKGKTYLVDQGEIQGTVSDKPSDKINRAKQRVKDLDYMNVSNDDIDSEIEKYQKVANDQ